MEFRVREHTNKRGDITLYSITVTGISEGLVYGVGATKDEAYESAFARLEDAHMRRRREWDDALSEFQYGYDMYRDAREIIKAIAEVETEDCRFDHHGYCQAHWLEEDCTVGKAKQWWDIVKED